MDIITFFSIHFFKNWYEKLDSASFRAADIFLSLRTKEVEEKEKKKVVIYEKIIFGEKKEKQGKEKKEKKK